MGSTRVLGDAAHVRGRHRSAGPHAEPARALDDATPVDLSILFRPRFPASTDRRLARTRDPPVRGEGLRHLPERGGEPGVPGSPAGDKPGRDGPLERTPRESVGVADRVGSRPMAGHRVQSYRRGWRPARARTPGSGGCRIASASPRAVSPTRTGPSGASWSARYASNASSPREVALGDPERPADGPGLLVEAAGGPVGGPGPRVIDDDRRVDQRRVDPQGQGRIAGVVARAGDGPVQCVAAGGSRRAPRRSSRRRSADSCATCRPAGATDPPGNPSARPRRRRRTGARSGAAGRAVRRRGA